MITLIQLAKLTGLTKGKVFNRLRRAGLEPVHRGSIGFKGNNPSRYDRDAALAILMPLVELANEKASSGLHSVAQIALRHGVRRQSVEEKLARWGVLPVISGKKGRGNSRLYDPKEADLAMALHTPGISFWETSTTGTYTLEEIDLRIRHLIPRSGFGYIRSLSALIDDALLAFRNDPTYLIRMMEDAREILDAEGCAA